MFKPTFEKVAKEHAGKALFLSCLGDSNGSTAKVMKRLAIKCAAARAPLPAPLPAPRTRAHARLPCAPQRAARRAPARQRVG